MVFDGVHIWVANSDGESVTELNADSGTPVGEFFTVPFDINPLVLAFDGANIWVVNASLGSVSKF